MSSVEHNQRLLVASEALSWVNTPYHHHARIKGVGVDCAQLLCAVFESAGMIPHVDPGFYPVDWHLHRNEELFLTWLHRYTRPLGDRPLGIGDVAVFQYGRTFSHGTIYIGNNLFVHSYLGRGVILSTIEEEPLSMRPHQLWSMW